MIESSSNGTGILNHIPPRALSRLFKHLVRGSILGDALNWLTSYQLQNKAVITLATWDVIKQLFGMSLEWQEMKISFFIDVGWRSIGSVFIDCFRKYRVFCQKSNTILELSVTWFWSCLDIRFAKFAMFLSDIIWRFL